MLSIQKEIVQNYWEEEAVSQEYVLGEVRDFALKRASHWLLNAVAGPVSF